MSARHSTADAELIRQVVALGCREPRFDRSQEPGAFEAWATRAVAVIAARYTPDLPACRAEADRHAGLRGAHPRRSIGEAASRIKTVLFVRVCELNAGARHTAMRILDRLQALGISIEDPFAISVGLYKWHAADDLKALPFGDGDTEHQLEGDLFGRIFANVDDGFISHIDSPLDRGLPQPASSGSGSPLPSAPIPRFFGRGLTPSEARIVTASRDAAVTRGAAVFA